MTDVTENEYGRALAGGIRVLIVAGMSVGLIVAGVGSRLAMLLLRLTSPDAVHDVQSDDGFTIGEVTLGGTYDLLGLGAVVGVIGAAAYQWVRPVLLGPWWFRRSTTALASGVVVGSLLLHADGVDFRVLEPTWLAIALFVALPALFGLAIGPVVDRVAQPGSWTTHGWKHWTIPVILVVVFPLTVLVLAPAAAILAGWLLIRDRREVDQLRGSAMARLGLRAMWLIVAGLGAVALVADVVAIDAVT